MTKAPIVRTSDGFQQDFRSVINGLLILTWNIDGKYLGQWQDDMFGTAPRVFISDGGGLVPNLTKSQMEQALSASCKGEAS